MIELSSISQAPAMAKGEEATDCDLPRIHLPSEIWRHPPAASTVAKTWPVHPVDPDADHHL